MQTIIHNHETVVLSYKWSLTEANFTNHHNVKLFKNAIDDAFELKNIPYVLDLRKWKLEAPARTFYLKNVGYAMWQNPANFNTILCKECAIGCHRGQLPSKPLNDTPRRQHKLKKEKDFSAL